MAEDEENSEFFSLEVKIFFQYWMEIQLFDESISIGILALNYRRQSVIGVLELRSST